MIDFENCAVPYKLVPSSAREHVQILLCARVLSPPVDGAETSWYFYQNFSAFVDFKKRRCSIYEQELSGK